MIRKLIKLNSFNTLGISIPADYIKELGLTADDSVNVTLIGHKLMITRVVVE